MTSGHVEPSQKIRTFSLAQSPSHWKAEVPGRCKAAGSRPDEPSQSVPPPDSGETLDGVDMPMWTCRWEKEKCNLGRMPTWHAVSAEWSPGATITKTSSPHAVRRRAISVPISVANLACSPRMWGAYMSVTKSRVHLALSRPCRKCLAGCGLARQPPPPRAPRPSPAPSPPSGPLSPPPSQWPPHP